jgi:hypothetical protein
MRPREKCTKAWCEDEGFKKGWSETRCRGDHDVHLRYSWGRCRSGKRWFWSAREQYNVRIRGDDHEGREWYGWADTEEAATEAARAAIRADAGDALVSVSVRHGWTSSKLAELSREERKAKWAANPPKQSGVADHGALWAYHAYYGDMGAPDRGWAEHRIVRKTRKYIWLASEYDEDGAQFRLDREALERDGHAWGGQRFRDRNDYYTLEAMKAYEADKVRRHAEWLRDRFKPLPEMPENYTKEGVAKAFREGSLLHHPDHGGDAETFRALVKAKEDALDVLAEIEAARGRAKSSQDAARAEQEARQ